MKNVTATYKDGSTAIIFSKFTESLIAEECAKDVAHMENVYKVEVIEDGAVTFTTYADLSTKEKESFARVASAIITGLNKRKLTVKRVREIAATHDHKAAFSLGLTVATRGICHEHDLQSPIIIKLVEGCARRPTKIEIIAAFKDVRNYFSL
jgi:hypothetical protein